MTVPSLPASSASSPPAKTPFAFRTRTRIARRLTRAASGLAWLAALVAPWVAEHGDA